MLLKYRRISNEFHACLCYLYCIEDIHNQLLGDITLPVAEWYKVRYM